MIFLNPAILFGLLAASIPVLIHMLNLRKLKKIDFSTLSFLKELQKNKIRKIKFKQWLLLVLRILVILFLVMAFARPAIKGIAIGGTTSAAKTTAVFILDNTFSMSAVDSKGSYFNQAKETIIKLMNELQEGDDAALILVSGNNQNEVKTTGNLVDFKKEINSVSVASPSGFLHNALVKAAKIIGESKNFNKEIYILSDFQEGRLFENEQLSDFSQLLNEKVRIYTFNYSGKQIYNLGIDKLKIENQIFEKDKPVTFDVTVTNYSSQPAQNIVVSLFLNNERSSQKSISLSAGATISISMDAVPKQSGYIDVTAEIEDDDILQDNKRFSNLFIPDKIPIIIFSNDKNDAKFVQLALTAGDDRGTINITDKNLNQLSSIDLNQFETVIIIGSDNVTGLDRLQTYLQNGGSLFLMPGSNSEVKKFGEILKNLSLPSPIGEFGKINSTDNSAIFDKIEFNHPIFRDIFSDSKKKNIESPHIYHFIKYSTEGKGSNIITLMDGSSFLGEYKAGNGKILLMNTAPVPSWSNFPLKGIFVPLMNKSVYYLASKNISTEEYIAGSSIEINLGDNSSPQVKIIKPDKSEEILNLDKNLKTNYIDYKNADITGNYKIQSGTKIINEISVNADPNESVTKSISDNDFEEYLKKINFKGKWIKVSKDKDPAEVILQSRFGSELWKYFILMALLIALIEMAVARNAKKELLNFEK